MSPLRTLCCRPTVINSIQGIAGDNLYLTWWFIAQLSLLTCWHALQHKGVGTVECSGVVQLRRTRKSAESCGAKFALHQASRESSKHKPTRRKFIIIILFLRQPADLYSLRRTHTLGLLLFHSPLLAYKSDIRGNEVCKSKYNVQWFSRSIRRLMRNETVTRKDNCYTRRLRTEHPLVFVVKKRTW